MRCERYVRGPKAAVEDVEEDPVPVVLQVALAARDEVPVKHDPVHEEQEVAPEVRDDEDHGNQRREEGPAYASDTADPVQAHQGPGARKHKRKTRP